MDTQAVLTQLLADTERPLALAEADLRSAQEKLTQIKAERYGLELALARYRQERPPAPAGADSEGAIELNGWRRINRAEAIERVLREAGKSLHRTALVAEMHAHGRDDQLEHASAALAYLNSKGRAIGLGQGMWVHPDYAPPRAAAAQLNGTGRPSLGQEPEQSDGPAEAGPSEGVPTA